jgi:hypothetical protein
MHTQHTPTILKSLMFSRNGIILLQLPGHTTQRLQPLDVSIFVSVETYYGHAVEKRLRSKAGVVVTQNNVTELLV